MKSESTATVNPKTRRGAGGTVSSVDNSSAYKKLTAFKTNNYAAKTVGEFNNALSEKDDLSELFEAYSEVMETLSEDDDNYEFISVTLNASLDELYAEQVGDEISFSDYVERKEHPIVPLQIMKQESEYEMAYTFIFSALYSVHYRIVNPDIFTVVERDNALLAFHTEFQNYIEGLSETELMGGNIREVITNRADEISNSLSSEELKLTCEISNIEVHDSGNDELK
ncbi:MAG TPA: hypothetical protein IAC62_16140 [Candidatus Pelethocola excrementipullorum]|nr:hypothetical protein [Candidatus Pelethocola excrementipullorum]